MSKVGARRLRGICPTAATTQQAWNTVRANGWAFAAAGAAMAMSLAAAPDWNGLTGAGLASLMAAIAVMDSRWLIIPDRASAAAFLLGLIHAGLLAPQAPVAALIMAMLRAVVLALLFAALRAAHGRWRGREGLGLGDVKLAGVCGAWLDWLTIPLALEIATFAALAAYAWRAWILRRPVNLGTRMPFGLFLAPAIWLGWLFETLMGKML